MKHKYILKIFVLIKKIKTFNYREGAGQFFF